MNRFRKTSIGCALALTAARASAREAVPVVVEFTAPPGCSDRETFAAGLRVRSDRIQIVESRDRAWVVNVGLSPRDGGVHGELRLTDDRGESERREVDGADCAEVVEALSLTAALAIEETVAKASSGDATPGFGESPPSGLGGAPSPTAGAKAPSTATDQPKTEDDSNREGDARALAWDSSHVGLGAIVTERVSPKTSFGVSFTLARRFALGDGWAPEFSLVLYYVPRETLQPRGELGVGYLGGALWGCPFTLAPVPAVRISPCATFEWGRLTVIEQRVEVSSPSTRLTGFVGGGARGRVRLSRHLELDVGFGLLAPLAARRYVAYFPSREVAHTAPVAWQVNVGWLFGWR